MSLRLPKSNIEWTVGLPGDNARRVLTLAGTYTMPSGRRVVESISVPDYKLANFPIEYGNNIVNGLVSRLAAEVGRAMVLGEDAS